MVYDMARAINPPVNALGAYAQGMKLGEEMRQQKSKNALMDARKGYGKNFMQQSQTEGGQFDAAAYASAVAQDAAAAGDFDYFSNAQDVVGKSQKNNFDSNKDGREGEKHQFEQLGTKLKLQGQLLGGVRDQATWDQALRIAQANGIDVSNIPTQYDPKVVQDISQMTLTAQDRIAQEWKRRGFDLDVAQFGYQQRNDAANRSVTIRGQNMTDARARDAIGVKNDQKANDRIEGAAATDIAIDTLDTLMKHPGKQYGTGSIIAPIARNIPGTSAKGFAAQLDQFKSQTFLPAVQQMKGMGQLSNAEGAALQKAVGNLDPDMPTEEFNAMANKIKAQMEAYRQRKFGDIPKTEWDNKPAANEAPMAPRPGTVKDGYLFRGGNPADPAAWSKVR